MGQRLNLEIVDNNRTLANAYYHWSAYTGSAIEITESAISAYYDSPDDLSSLGIAVYMLQETGAGIYSEERDRIEKNDSEKYKGIVFKDAIDRNRGLLSVTEVGIEETERWEEGRVTINIESGYVSFGVLWECTKDEYNDDMDDENAFDSLDECDVVFEDISFDEFYRIRHVYENYNDGFRTPYGYAVSWIG